MISCVGQVKLQMEHWRSYLQMGHLEALEDLDDQVDLEAQACLVGP